MTLIHNIDNTFYRPMIHISVEESSGSYFVFVVRRGSGTTDTHS
jgi:hypothetical protein